jgi:hypothetical protein
VRIREARFANHDCVEIEASDLNCFVTVDSGPRILGLNHAGGENLFFESTEAGTRDEFRSIGGHRLWVAPENEVTYFPDNHPVQWKHDKDEVWFAPPPEQHKNGVCLSKRLSIGITGAGVQVRHSIRNCGDKAMNLACWAITMMAPGGVAALPLPKRAPHDMEHLLPTSQLALWSYTDFSDPRWTFLPDRILLRHESHPRAQFQMQKTGLFHPRGWVAYLLNRQLFVKSILEANSGNDYPDRGCNLECFTNPEFLEVETLGPLVTLHPQESIGHLESWSVFGNDEGSMADSHIQQKIHECVRLTRQHMPAQLTHA